MQNSTSPSWRNGAPKADSLGFINPSIRGSDPQVYQISQFFVTLLQATKKAGPNIHVTAQRLVQEFVNRSITPEIFLERLVTDLRSKPQQQFAPLIQAGMERFRGGLVNQLIALHGIAPPPPLFVDLGQPSSSQTQQYGRIPETRPGPPGTTGQPGSQASLNLGPVASPAANYDGHGMSREVASGKLLRLCDFFLNPGHPHFNPSFSRVIRQLLGELISGNLDTDAFVLQIGTTFQLNGNIIHDLRHAITICLPQLRNGTLTIQGISPATPAPHAAVPPAGPPSRLFYPYTRFTYNCASCGEPFSGLPDNVLPTKEAWYEMHFQNAEVGRSCIISALGNSFFGDSPESAHLTIVSAQLVTEKAHCSLCAGREIEARNMESHVLRAHKDVIRAAVMNSGSGGGAGVMTGTVEGSDGSLRGSLVDLHAESNSQWKGATLWNSLNSMPDQLATPQESSVQQHRIHVNQVFHSAVNPNQNYPANSATNSRFEPVESLRQNRSLVVKAEAVTPPITNTVGSGAPLGRPLTEVPREAETAMPDRLTSNLRTILLKHISRPANVSEISPTNTPIPAASSTSSSPPKTAETPKMTSPVSERPDSSVNPSKPTENPPIPPLVPESTKKASTTPETSVSSSNPSNPTNTPENHQDRLNSSINASNPPENPKIDRAVPIPPESPVDLAKSVETPKTGVKRKNRSPSPPGSPRNPPAGLNSHESGKLPVEGTDVEKREKIAEQMESLPSHRGRTLKFFLCHCGEARATAEGLRAHRGRHGKEPGAVEGEEEWLRCPRLNCGYVAWDTPDYARHCAVHVALQRSRRLKMMD